MIKIGCLYKLKQNPKYKWYCWHSTHSNVYYIAYTEKYSNVYQKDGNIKIKPDSVLFCVKSEFLKQSFLYSSKTMKLETEASLIFYEDWKMM